MVAEFDLDSRLLSVALDVRLNIALPEKGGLGGRGVADAGQAFFESLNRSVNQRGLYTGVTS
jgi:hypothetical protein